MANLFGRLFKMSIQSNEKLYILCYDVTARSLSMTNGSKYRQVEQYIIKEIEKGNLRTGDQIMTEEQLCEKFGFSRMTVNKALNRLSESGYKIGRAHV